MVIISYFVDKRFCNIAVYWPLMQLYLEKVGCVRSLPSRRYIDVIIGKNLTQLTVLKEIKSRNIEAYIQNFIYYSNYDGVCRFRWLIRCDRS